MNDDYTYANPIDYTMQAPTGCCKCGQCGMQPNLNPGYATMPGYTVEYPMGGTPTYPTMPTTQGFPTYTTMPMTPGISAYPTMPYMTKPGETADYKTDNEERVIPLLVGGLVGAAVASRPYGYGYAYPQPVPYTYGYYNYYYGYPRRPYYPYQRPYYPYPRPYYGYR